MDANINYNEEYKQILQRVSIAKQFTRPWHDNINKWQRLYNFDHYDTQPKSGESRFADPTYTNTVDLAVGIVLANAVNWKAKAWNPNQNAEDSSLVEKFLSGTLEVNADRNEYDINYEILLHFVRDGGAILYTVWDEQIAATSKRSEVMVTSDGEEVPITVYQENPIRTQVIDPRSIFLVPGGRKRWSAIMRIEEKSVFDVFSEFGIILDEDKHLSTITEQITSKGELIDYWDVAIIEGKQVVRNCIMYKGKPIRELQIMEKYSSIPYTISFFKPTGRQHTSDWHSILTPLEHPLENLEKSINRRQRQIDIYSSLPMVSKTDGGRTISLDPGMGKIVQLSREEDFGFPVWPGNPPDVREQIDFLRSRVQQSGFSDVFYGSGASATSGYAISQLGDQNRIRLEQPIVHLQRLWSWWAKKTVDLALSHAKDEFILVYGTARDKMFYEALPVSLIAGHHIVCEIVPEFPNEQVRKHAMANQVRGLLSDARIMEEYLGVQQPDEELDRKMTEIALNHPVLVQFAMINKLRDMAENGNESAAMALQSLQQGVPGQPGRPEEPHNFEQGRGLPNRPPRPYGQTMSGAIEDQSQAAPNMEGGISANEIF